MSENKQDIETNEDRYKDLLYDKIGEIISKQSESITHMCKTGQYIDIDTDIPNIGITVKNKLNELSKTFKEAGISLFSESNEKNDSADSNFVGNSIIEDIISQLSKGTQAWSEYTSSIDKTTKERTEKIKALEQSGTIKKIFLKIRSFFVPTTVSDLISYSDKEIEEVKSHLLEYKEIDENLWEYNLRDNVVQSLVKYINNRQSRILAIPGLIEESVVPTLQKLGLEDTIPQLQEELSKTQEQSKSSNNKSWELSPIQRLGIQISSERVAKEFEQNGSNTMEMEEKEYTN